MNQKIKEISIMDIIQVLDVLGHIIVGILSLALALVALYSGIKFGKFMISEGDSTSTVGKAGWAVFGFSLGFFCPICWLIAVLLYISNLPQTSIRD
jgi:hypothetical protein